MDIKRRKDIKATLILVSIIAGISGLIYVSTVADMSVRMVFLTILLIAIAMITLFAFWKLIRVLID